MATAPMDTVIRHLRRTVLLQDGAGRTDGELLASFIERQDEAAFAALVRRHGPMVFGVCRRVIRNHHDAEDAFQATFLVLARKAASVTPREKIAGWLYGVAYRTALKARTRATKRRVRETQVMHMPEPAVAPPDQSPDLQPLLDQELNGLPAIYRLPILLCDLEGKSIKEAMQQLGWPQGTLAGRLARGRKLLAKRLARRGLVLPGGVPAMMLSRNGALADVPTSLAYATVKAAALMAAGQAAAGGMVPAEVAALVQGVMTGMTLTKLKQVVVASLVAAALACCGVGLVMPRAAAEHTELPKSASQAEQTLNGTANYVVDCRLIQTTRDGQRTRSDLRLLAPEGVPVGVGVVAEREPPTPDRADLAPPRR